MSKIASNLLKLGRKTAEDISLTIDNGTANLPEIKYDNAAGNFKFSNDGTNFFDFGSGSGSGEINYIDNWDFETDTSGWATYADAAGTTPVDGDGGSPNVAISSQATTVLRGGKSLKLVKDAVDRQGEGFSYDFSIKEQDIQKKLKIQFDFKTNEDAAYANGDLTVYIYDVTNAALITPVDTDIISGQNIFQTSFVSTASTSYRLIFHIATTNASAWDAYVDNVIVGPGQTSQGAAVGEMSSATISASEFNNATGLSSIPGEFQWQRVGANLHVNISFYAVGTGTDASPFQFQPDSITGFPSNLTFTSGIYGSGVIRRDNSTGTSRSTTAGVLSCDGTGNIMFKSSPDVADLDGNEFGSTGTLLDEVNITAILPVAEWAGKGIVPMLAEDNLSEWTSYTPAGLTGGEWGTSTSINMQYRRVGDSIQIRGEFTSGTCDPEEGQIDLPSGLTIGGTNTGTTLAGSLATSVSFSSASVIFYLLATPGDTYLNFSRQLSTTNTSTLDAIDADNANATRISIESGLVPIQEWAGSQNSLVGYSEASSSLLGLTKKNRAQVRTLGSDITTPTVDIADLRFVNLIVGKVYELGISAKQGTTGVGATENFALKANHNGSVILEDRIRYGNKPSGLFESNNGNTLIFTALTTSVTFDWEETGTGELAGNGTTQETHVTLKELNDYEPLTTAFSP